MSRRFDAAFVARYKARFEAGAPAPPPPVPAFLSARNGTGGLGGAVSASARQPATTPVRILGIDTSLRCTGLAIIEAVGSEMRFVDARPIPNPRGRSIPDCLVHIAETLEKYIDEFRPQEAAMEGIFFCKNPRTALVLGHARGVVVMTCARASLAPTEYPPALVKRAVTGAGSATKDQMQRMMQRVFSLPELPQEDSADALAIAVTHAHQRRISALRAAAVSR